MNTKYLFISIIAGSVLFFSCDELFETDLSKEDVILVAPSDNVSTIISEQTFKWEPVEGAEKYNIQIVSPGFHRITTFVLDSNTVKTSFTVQLLPGVYQWRVCAWNNSSVTPYSVNSLTIDTNKVFTNNIINLISPSLNYINFSKVLFSWSKVDGADKYRFEMRMDDWKTGELFLVKDVFHDTVTLNLQEGNYFWGVQAVDNETNSQTRFSYQQILIDRTVPNTPTLIFPNPNGEDTIKENILKLEWSRKGANGNGGAPIDDSIYVSKNVQFTDLILKAVTSDSSLTIQPEPGQFYWKVKSVDRAKNTSGYSSIGKIIVKY